MFLAPHKINSPQTIDPLKWGSSRDSVPKELKIISGYFCTTPSPLLKKPPENHPFAPCEHKFRMSSGAMHSPKTQLSFMSHF